MLDVKDEFPALLEAPEIAYLDSAATSQKPAAVIDAVREQLTSATANTGRGIYPWANAATSMVEDVRVKVLDFLDAPDHSTLHFTSGTTEALDLVASEYLMKVLPQGAQMIVPLGDHEANARPWLNLAERLRRFGRDVMLTPIPYEDSGDYDYTRLSELVTDDLAFVAMTHVHHVYGCDTKVEQMRKVVGPDVPICLDAAQSFGHMRISLDELDVDFLAFSGHKALAPNGTGSLWSRNTRTAPLEISAWNGTPNITGIAGLGAAIDWLTGAGIASVEKHIAEVTDYAVSRLDDLDDITFVGCELGCSIPESYLKRHGLVAFRHSDISSGDLGFILAADNVYVRSDSHCQAGATSDSASVRASFHVYTSKHDIDRMIDILTSL